MMRMRLKVVTFLSAAALLAMTLVAAAYFAVKLNARNKNFVSTDNVPYNKVGLLLGTSPKMPSGKPNFFFTSRIQAAVRLYESGKISYILVSGDNGTKEYDEPTWMKEALMAAGVPEKAIVLDYAGFRTLDSIVRAKEVFGQSSITVISHRFHTERAICIAEHHGMEAVGYCAKDPALTKRSLMTTIVRESASRVKMYLDLLMGKQPKFLGEKIEIK